MQFVYDTAVLIAAEGGEQRVWAIHKRSLARDAAPVVPAGVLTEAWRPGGYALGRFLAGCEIEALTEVHARRAGVLLGRVGRDVSAVDATVAEAALRLGAAVLTSDRTHFAALSAAAGRPISIVSV